MGVIQYIEKNSIDMKRYLLLYIHVIIVLREQ
jgi:hypothetical protein